MNRKRVVRVKRYAVQTRKRLLSAFLSVILAASLLPLNALASEEGPMDSQDLAVTPGQASGLEAGQQLAEGSAQASGLADAPGEDGGAFSPDGSTASEGAMPEWLPVPDSGLGAQAPATPATPATPAASAGLAALAGTSSPGTLGTAGTAASTDIAPWAATPEEDFYFDAATGTITGYLGSDADIVFPDTIGNVTVAAIGESAFKNAGLHSLVLPNGLKSINAHAFQGNDLGVVVIPAGTEAIGEYAFADAGVTSLNLPSTLVSLGAYAFMTNRLMSLSLPASLAVVPQGAFMQNHLSSVGLGAVEAIGEAAFADNRLTEADLPGTLQRYGTNVFLENAGFVRLTGNTALAQTYGVVGKYGEYIGELRTITVRLTDKANGTAIIDDIVIKPSNKVQSVDRLAVDGNQYRYTAPTLVGYSIYGGDTQAATINGDTIMTFEYVDETGLPTISGADASIQLVQGDPWDAAVLLDGVSAVDYDGSDLTSRISLSGHDAIATDVPASWVVTYAVAGKNGTVYAARSVMVGADPLLIEIGDGWVYGDFIYGNEGRTLVGFSDQGLQKYYGGKTDLWIPSLCPYNGALVEEIDHIDDSAHHLGNFDFASITFVSGNQLKRIGPRTFMNCTSLTNLNLSDCRYLEVIDEYAFRYARKLSSLDLSGCAFLTTIGQEAFAGAEELRSIDFSGCTALATIGREAFAWASKLESLDLSGCTALERIDGRAFCDSSELVSLDLSGCGSLTVIEWNAFENASKLQSIDFRGCSSLAVIGDAAFANGESLLSLDLSPCGSLKEIRSGAFINAYNLQSIDLSGCAALESIGYAAFQYADKLEKLDLSGCAALGLIEDYAFEKAPLKKLDLGDCTALTTIGQDSFTSYAGIELDLGGMVALTTIKDRAFSGAQEIRSLNVVGCSSLEYIGNEAFRNAPLTSLDLSGCPNLKTIGQSAFYSASLSSLDLSGCSSLATLGGFDSSLLISLDLSGCTALTEITDYAFNTAPLLSLDLSGCTSLQRIGQAAFLGCRATSLDLSGCTSLESIEREAFMVAPLSSLDISGLSDLVTIGDGAFRDAQLAELDLSSCTALKHIGYGAFQESLLKELDLSGCIALEVIDGRAFDGSSLSELDLSSCTALKRIGDSAFANSPIAILVLDGLDQLEYLSGFNNSKITELDLNSLPAVTTIGGHAFERAPLTKLDLGTNLQVIGWCSFRSLHLESLDLSRLADLREIRSAAFENLWLTELDLSNNVALESIGSEAFRNIQLTELDLSKNAALKEIHYSAFENSPLERLDLSGCVALEFIAENAFSHARLTSLDLSGCPELRSIDQYAFQDSPLTGLDLRANTKLEWIYPEAFASLPDNAVVYLPDSVQGFRDYPFGQIFGAPEKTTWVYTASSASPLATRIFPAGNSRSTYRIFVNQAGYKLELRDQEDRIISSRSVPVDQAAPGPDLTVAAPVLQGYDIDPGFESQVISIVPGSLPVALFRYTAHQALPAGVGLTGFDMGIENEKWRYGENTGESDLDGTPRTKYWAGEDMLLTVKFALSSDAAAIPAGSRIVVPLYDECLDISRVEWPDISVAEFKDIQSIMLDPDAREVTITLNEVKGGTHLAIDFLLRYLRGMTPYGHETKYHAYLLDATGALAAATPVDASAQTTAEYGRNQFWAYAAGAAWGPPEGYFGSVSPDGSHILPGTEADVYFGYQLYPEWRSAENVTVTAMLPLYRDKDGTERTAEFNEADNPGWERSADGKKVVLADSIKRIDTQCLRLRFPSIATDQLIRINMQCVMLPLHANAYEKAGYLAALDGSWADESNLNWYEGAAEVVCRPARTIDLPDIVAFSKEVATWKANRSFYDTLEARSREFVWDLTLILRSDFIGKGLTFEDSRLDYPLGRMEYVGVRNPNNTTMGITAYGAGAQPGDPEVFLSYVESDAAQYNFPQSLVPQITSLKITLPGFVMNEVLNSAQRDTKQQKEVKVQVVTRMKDPATPILASGQQDLFFNTGNGSMDVHDPQDDTLVSQYSSVNDGSSQKETYYRAQAVNETFAATCTNYPKGMLGLREPIYYTVGVQGVKPSDTQWTDFAMLDLLPKDSFITDITLSEDFAASPGCAYKIITNYQGTGRTAVVFTAKRLATPATFEGNGFLWSMVVAYITVETGLTSTTSYVNEVYASAQNPAAPGGIGLQNRVEDIYDINAYGDEASYKSVSNGVWSIRGLNMRKFIHAGNYDWSQEGGLIMPGREFEYMVKVVNNWDQPIVEPVFYDIFPYMGDYSLDVDKQSGNLIPRNSQFRNIFVSLVLPTGYTAYYTDDPAAENSEAFFAQAAWKPLPGAFIGTASIGTASVGASPAGTSVTPASFDPADVTGLKIVADPGIEIPSRSDLAFYITMAAPLDPEMKLEGLRAYGSVARTDSSQSRALESNSAYNEIVYEGDIILRKVDPNGNPLAGAVFQIANSAGKVITTVESDTNGMVSFDDLPFDTYKITEVKAPDGYQLLSAPLYVARSQMRLDVPFDLGDIEDLPLPPPVQYASASLVKNSVTGTPITGATFRVTGLDAGVNDHINKSVSSTSKGNVVFRDLPLGNYHIEEERSVGRLVPEYSADFTLDTEGQVKDLGLVLNPHATITLCKIGVLSDDLKAVPDAQLEATSGMRMAGVTFNLYDGAALKAQGQTDAQGLLVFSSLDVEKEYTLVETEDAATDGFEPRQASYKVMVDAKGVLWVQGEKYTKQYLVIGNNSVGSSYYALLQKLDDSGSSLAGVDFLVYSLDPGITTTMTIATNAAGEIELSDTLLRDAANFGPWCPDDLYVKEVQAPLGYYIEPGSTPLSATGPGWHINLRNGYETIQIVNKASALDVRSYVIVADSVRDTLQALGLTALLSALPTGADLSDLTSGEQAMVAAEATAQGFQLTEEAGQYLLRSPLAGVKVAVREKGAATYDDTNSFEALTDAQGRIAVPGTFLIDEEKSYTVLQLEAPAGYLMGTNTLHDFRVAALKLHTGFDGTVRFAFDNTSDVGAIKVTKMDKLDSVVLPGVGFELYSDAGTLIDTQFTDKNGVAAFVKVPFGSYYVKECAPLANYEIDPTEHPVTLSLADPIAYIQVYDETIEKRSTLNIHVADDAGTPLAGIEFMLLTSADGGATWTDYEAAGMWPYPRTNRAGDLSIRDLPAGLYCIVEVSDLPYLEAPSFSPSDTFEVKSNVAEVFEVDVVHAYKAFAGSRVFKDVENSDVFEFSDLTQSFTWHIVAAFGDTDRGWTQVEIIDPLEDVLEVKGLSIMDSLGNTVTDYSYDLDPVTNILTIELQPLAGGFGHLVDQIYIVSLETSIHADTSKAQLEAYQAAGGIPNQAELSFNGQATASEVPLVLYSPTPPATGMEQGTEQGTGTQSGEGGTGASGAMPLGSGTAATGDGTRMLLVAASTLAALSLALTASLGIERFRKGRRRLHACRHALVRLG
ncbi:MAG: leucine-rich repeat protein [Coriobacteriaceae bacterium]|nr:leucine-rich repeat protein [Coriobacteriaceae bacterium]